MLPWRKLPRRGAGAAPAPRGPAVSGFVFEDSQVSPGFLDGLHGALPPCCPKKQRRTYIKCALSPCFASPCLQVAFLQAQSEAAHCVLVAERSSRGRRGAQERRNNWQLMSSKAGGHAASLAHSKHFCRFSHITDLSALATDSQRVGKSSTRAVWGFAAEAGRSQVGPSQELSAEKSPSPEGVLFVTQRDQAGPSDGDLLFS